MKNLLAVISFCWIAPLLAQAQDVTTYEYDGSFEDAAFNLESAIIARGYVVDHISHVGEMLNRTAADVGSTVTIFEAADVYQFCSAVLSRKVMEADPLNISHCPYGVFVIQLSGEDTVRVGYGNMPDGAMQEVQSLLDELAREAMEQ